MSRRAVCILFAFLLGLTSFLAEATAQTNTLDNGIDPYNLGKGDWIWQMPASQAALGVGSVQAVIDYEVSKGVEWLTVKCGDGGGAPWAQFNADLITRCHNSGLKIFGWAYVYGTNVAGEINVASNAFWLGADGLIVDAESQYETDTNPYGHANAIKYCQAIRKLYPNRFLAHGPSPSVHFHPGFPYVDFGMYVDTTMPQDYWGYRGISPAAMINLMEDEFRTNLHNKWVGSATNAIKPIAPVAQADMPNVTGAELNAFVYLLRNDATPLTPSGYRSVSFWDCQEHSADHWAAIAVTNVLVMTTNKPVIAISPFNRCVDVGSNATYSARAYGAPPLIYQWQFNGTNLAGATGSRCVVTNADLLDAGPYSVVVTNSFGAVTSTVAKLTVVSPLPTLQLAFADNFDTNSAALWSVFQGSGNSISDFATNWAFDYSTQMYTAVLVGYTKITNAIPAAPGTTNGTRLGLKLAVNKNDGTASQSGVSLYPKAMNFGSNCVLRFDAWINYAGGPFGIGATGTTEMVTCGLNHTGTRANWMDVNSTSSDGTWFAVAGDGASGNRHVQSYSAGTDYRAYQGNGAAAPTLLSFANSGMGIGGAVSEDCIDLFYGNLFGYPNYETPGVPGKRWLQVELSQINKVLTWRLNGVIVAQRTNTSSFTNGNAMIGYLDPFTSISNPKEDNYAIIDNVRVYTVVDPLQITQQPTNTTVIATSNAAFTVQCLGMSPGYQWRRNLGILTNGPTGHGSTISGATSPTLTISNVATADAANYLVQITNTAGVLLSSNVALSVIVPPSIELPPANLMVNAGGDAAFSVGASGTPPLSYQWRLANTNLPGATGTNLVLTSVQTNQAGAYSVIITNAAGVIQSSNAILSVVQMRISSVTMSNDNLQFDASGAPGVYTILTSSNLIVWLSLTLWTNAGSNFQFSETFSNSVPQHFYRVSTPK
jgi:hypothetical protein